MARLKTQSKRTPKRRRARGRNRKTKEGITPRVKDILRLLESGATLAAIFAVPALSFAAAPFLASQSKFDWERYKKEWEKYNPWLLRQTLKRLREQKMVRIVEENSNKVVKLTEKGKLKLLKYNLEEMNLKKPGRWDKKWRFVIYDVPKEKTNAARAFRSLLQQLKFFRLQKSVYLTPFPCEDEINYLRELFDIGENVVILIVEGLENSDPYRRYFGI